MHRRPLGNTGMNASVVGLGTWVMGGGQWWRGTDDAESIRAIHAAIDAGINLIDTAPAYGFGRSEEIVGQAVRGRRDQVLIATKLGLWWQDGRGSDFVSVDGRTIRRSLRPDTMQIELENSLRRLGVETIDLYQTHWQSIEPDKTPIAESMGVLERMREAGKIRAIGVSNCTPEQMDAYRAVGPLASNQPKFSMLDRGIEDGIVPYCLACGISILAYSPLEMGLLTGKFGMDRVLSAGEARNYSAWFRPENRRGVLSVLEGWKDLCERYACTLSQLVIAWTIAQPGITVALVGARNPEQALSNAQAGRLRLAPADMERMRGDVERLPPAL